LNYTKDVWNDPASPYFAYDSGFPGIDPADCVNVALEATGWLSLPAGISEFGIKSDDGIQVTSGSGFTDPNPVVLGFRSGGTYDGTFKFVTEAAGLYPVRLVFNQASGGAYLQFYSVDSATSTSILINDTNVTAVAAFVTYTALESSPTLSPPAFTVEASAAINTSTKTITVAQSGAQRFYRIRTVGTAPRITNVQQSGSNLILTYQ
jgi:hypothetical protein